MAKLTWRVKLVAELGPDTTFETEVARANTVGSSSRAKATTPPRSAPRMVTSRSRSVG
jgi:hypothetical protein